MRFIIANLLIFITFVGCGSDSDKEVFKQDIENSTKSSQASPAPQNDTNTQKKEDDDDSWKEDEDDDIWKDEDEAPKPTPTTQTNTYSGPFKNAKNLIKKSQNKEIEGATYICFGDSTRSYSHYQNQYIFEDIKYRLNDYGINSINASVSGLKARDASWSDIVEKIPSDGSTTILDISLGLNDYGDYSSDQIKYSLESIIQNIKSRKPGTNFILTIPNRVYYNKDYMSDVLSQVYRDLSSEFNIPYIDVPNEAMPLDDLSLDWYREGDQTHLKRAGQDRIAQLILSKILP
jgi:lysophospholipase L1-like esterase